jgi:hypothetical protein
MQSRVDLNRKIRALVAMCTGIAPAYVSPARQELDVPPAPQVWATVLVTVYGPVGMDEVRYKDSSNNLVSETVEGSRLCVASIQFYRAPANDLANKFRTRIRMSQAVEYMRANDIGFVDIGPVNDLTEVESENWEERAQLDMRFNTSVTDTLELDTYGIFPIKLYTDEPPTERDILIYGPGELGGGAAENAITTESGDVLTTESGEQLGF